MPTGSVTSFDDPRGIGTVVDDADGQEQKHLL